MVLSRICLLGLGFLTSGCIWELYEPEPSALPTTVYASVHTGNNSGYNCAYRFYVEVQRCMVDPSLGDTACNPPPDLVVRMGEAGNEMVLSPSNTAGYYEGCTETQPDPWIIDVQVQGGSEHIHAEMPALAIVELKPAFNGVSWTPSGDPDVTMDFSLEGSSSRDDTPDDGYEDFSTLEPPPVYPRYLRMNRHKIAPSTATFRGSIVQDMVYPNFEPLPP